MSNYKHLTACEREMIMLWLSHGWSITDIANYLQRSKSTISREIKRNTCVNFYRASTAQQKYETKRLKCRMKKILSDKSLKTLVREKILSNQWSPEQIAGRLRYYEDCTNKRMEDVVKVTLFDVNNDGTPELFFCRYTVNQKDILILDMYTLDNDSAVKAISCEYYESYAYCNCVGLVHADDTQMIDVLALNGTYLEISATYAPKDNFSYTKDKIPGTTKWLADC